MFQSLFTNNLIAIRVEGTYIFIGDLLLKCEALTFGSENSVKLNKRAQKGKKRGDLHGNIPYWNKVLLPSPHFIVCNHSWKLHSPITGFC